MSLQQAHIHGVALEHTVQVVAQNRHKPDKQVDKNDRHHHEMGLHGQAALHFCALSPQPQGHVAIDGVTDFGDDADDAAPAEADAAKSEEGAVEVVGAPTAGSEDLGIVLGDVARDLLFEFLHAARAGVTPVLVEGVLRVRDRVSGWACSLEGFVVFGVEGGRWQTWVEGNIRSCRWDLCACTFSSGY